MKKKYILSQYVQPFDSIVWFVMTAATKISESGSCTCNLSVWKDKGDWTWTDRGKHGGLSWHVTPCWLVCLFDFAIYTIFKNRLKITDDNSIKLKRSPTVSLGQRNWTFFLVSSWKSVYSNDTFLQPLHRSFEEDTMSLLCGTFPCTSHVHSCGYGLDPCSHHCCLFFLINMQTGRKLKRRRNLSTQRLNRCGFTTTFNKV